MNRTTDRGRPVFGPRTWPTLILVPVAPAAILAAAGTGGLLGADAIAIVAGLLAVFLALLAVVSRRRRRRALRRFADSIRAVAEDPNSPLELPSDPELDGVAAALIRLQDRFFGAQLDSSSLDLVRPDPSGSTQDAAMTRSGLYAGPCSGETCVDALASAQFTTRDMVSRLDPETLRWLDSSPAEQEFLGWPLECLRTMTFLEIVHPDHRELARGQLHAALIKGEAHGLIYRIRDAHGRPKAVEINVSVRYGSNPRATHLRCHVTDVTAKLQASRELRRRTRELAQANEQLRQVNRELQELKDRYGDLYQNAPTMYFSLDPSGAIREVNNTLLRTLGYQRRDLLGRSYACLLPPERIPDFEANQAHFLRTRRLEVESRWLRADGSPIDVWITASAVLDPEGQVVQSRSVAQDVTARRALEAELHEKNQRLAAANDELSRKNRELDEFTYVVSHDLQEPLRTLNAFSDFLLKDCGDQLDANGREHVCYIVEASRRMRALIRDLLDLSRVGRVTGEFSEVNLEEVVELVKADLAELIRSKGGEVCQDGDLPTVWGDPQRIAQLLVNLISNGLKYNQSSEPRIVIGAGPAESPGWITLRVGDNGIGIDPSFHDKIFRIFRRLHTREEYEGTGAGLAICQKIVQAHGGRIWVESEPGSGSTFFLTLPRKPETLALASARSSHTPRAEVLNGS